MEIKQIKVGRNEPCPCGRKNDFGKPIKFKRCCWDKVRAGNKVVQLVKITRNDFISEPYKVCPSCNSPGSFGVMVGIAGSESYTRECRECHYKKNISLPPLKEKKIIYLDQFVLSNLIKLLDHSHPSHEKVANGSLGQFWKNLFVALEKATKSQAIICPDSFYHKDESSVGSDNFRIVKRLYEHFSGGKTLCPSYEVQHIQMQHHFANWLDGKKSVFNFDPQEIAFGDDLNEWEIGIRVSVGSSLNPEELENLRQSNASTKQQLAEIWKRWQQENVSFEARAKEEVLGLGKGILQAVQDFIQKRDAATQRMAIDASYEPNIDDLFPNSSWNLLSSLMKIAMINGVSEQQLPEIIRKYLSDADALLQVPYLKISSVMFAGLARAAALGEKKAPKSTVDVQFISSYLPYCDAMFVDKQSARLLKELPRNTPSYLTLTEFDAKIFSLGEKEKFLQYLEDVVSQIPAKQMEVLMDVEGDSFLQPYWSIVEHEKRLLRGED